MKPITLDTLLKDIEWKTESIASDNVLYFSESFLKENGGGIGELGSITILDRVTGFTGFTGFIRATETAYTDKDGGFWLVFGMFDIREHKDIDTLTIEQAIEIIKKESELC